MATATASEATTTAVPWWGLETGEVAERLRVDAAVGLDDAELGRRRERYGSNELEQQRHEPWWRGFLRQYRDLLQLVLLGASIVALAIDELSTAAVVFAITLFNALLAMHQEGKAERGLAALRDMLRPDARVRRNGVDETIPAEELVPGDVVHVEHGDRIPADGRVIEAATLETDEGTLTGESTPVLKQPDPVASDAALADRLDMVFANTTATRGTGTFVVTATGMDSEVGRVAGMLRVARERKTPLVRQIDRLTRLILVLAALAFISIVVILRVREGDSWTDLFTIGVALAIGAIPDALPAVVTSVLAVGTQHMARRNAIVKTLPSAEALGSTSAICTDKTGTLTVGEMTARELVLADGNRYTVTGEGYGTEGRIRRVAGASEALDPLLLPMVLCADATVQNGTLVGDPNEGALVTLAMKGGLDVAATRAEHPRRAVLPFDSSYMLMATFHDAPDDASAIRCYVKGAPDVLLSRASRLAAPDSGVRELDDGARDVIDEELTRLERAGLRVMAVAQRDLDGSGFDPEGDLLGLVQDLTLLALVGIMDPPRAEAKSAIDVCHDAGIRVRMITGDQLVTAEATAADLDIEGEALTGQQFSACSDDELAGRLDGIGVVARVAPEDKVRLVESLQHQDNIVAMTGDGVNDAPALKAADIGVAMGTGTDVARDAGKMILTDDNFATIVAAVEEGRAIYDNLMKYIRVQMANLVGFVLGFVLAAAVDGSELFPPSQVLLIHFVVVATIGAALGFDTPAPDLMRRRPRRADEPVISVPVGARIVAAGALLAGVTLWTEEWAQGHYDSRLVAQSIALTVFAYGHIALALDLRYPADSVFSRVTLTNRSLWLAFGFVLLTPILVTELGVFQGLFDTTALTLTQWVVALGAAAGLVAASEIGKLGERLVHSLRR